MSQDMAGWGSIWLCACSLGAMAQQAASAQGDADTSSDAADLGSRSFQQSWNWHLQNTAIVQYHPGFAARYAGPNSLSSANEVKETASVDLYGGARLWPGAEAHLDALIWQGFGFSETRGVEAFPNGEAFRLGTEIPNVNLARVFIRQEFGLCEEEENVEDGALQLAGRRKVSRIALTLGRFSAKDVFDANAYANDSRTEFMNWSLMANEAWDYPSDSLGFTTGTAIELNLPPWCLRYGFFQMPRHSNGTATDPHYLEAWGSVAELEHRHTLWNRPGAVRLLVYLNRSNMGSLREALAATDRPADVQATRAYRSKWGTGLNVEQEIAKDIGAFLRLGWSDGKSEAWTFADLDHTATFGTSIKGTLWSRPGDTCGCAGGVNAISRLRRDYFAAGGVGILAGDGALNYGSEQFLETYYSFQVQQRIHFTVDYQFVAHPAYNRDRGPVSVIGGRVHWEF